MFSFRLAWGIWFLASLLDAAVYHYILSESGMHPRALVLAVLFVLQAVCVPVYALRTMFAGPREAVIRCAAGATIFAGVASTFSGSFEQFLSIPVSSAYLSEVQLGYVVSILVLNGITGGIAAGLLRWRVISTPPITMAPPSEDSAWRKDLRSYIIWVACVTLSRWVFGAFNWTIGLPATEGLMAPARQFYPFRGSFLAYVGIIFIAPIPFLFPPREGQLRGSRIARYTMFALGVAAVLFVACSATNLSWSPVYFLYLAIVLLTPALLWALAYGYSLDTFPNIPSPFADASSAASPAPALPSVSRALWLSAIGYAFALLAGWLAATHASPLAPRTSQRDAVPPAAFPASLSRD